MLLNEKPSLILITGIMASGKSTVAQLLAERFEKSVHLRGDVFRKMIVNDRKEISPDAQEDQLDQLRLRYRLTVHAAETYWNEGFTVVVQDVVIGPMLDEFMALIQARPLYVIVLCPDVDTVSRREAERPKTGYGLWTVAGLDAVLRNDTTRIGLWLDSSSLTPEQTVDEIIARMPKEAKVK